MNHEFHVQRKKLQPRLLHFIWLFTVCGFLWSCGFRHAVVTPPPRDLTWTERSIAVSELQAQAGENPDLTTARCMEILARLNHKDRCYIERDIKKGRVLKVPNDFRAYLDWTPLPSRLEREADVPEFILVVKDIGFLGWYENGKLLGSTYVCIGKKRKWTRSGIYKVMDKDIDHVSSSYNSAFGYPALMPFALRIYGRVWIHGGDVTRKNCSHGCINLPLDAAEELYAWADPGAKVLIIESLGDLDRAGKG